MNAKFRIWGKKQELFPRKQIFSSPSFLIFAPNWEDTMEKNDAAEQFYHTYRSLIFRTAARLSLIHIFSLMTTSVCRTA